MFSLSASLSYFLYRPSADMRKSFDGLCGLIQNEQGHDPLSGDVFIFINKRRNQVKILRWEQYGFILYYKRLETGTFELPQWDDDSALVLCSCPYPLSSHLSYPQTIY